MVKKLLVIPVLCASFALSFITPTKEAKATSIENAETVIYEQDFSSSEGISAYFNVDGGYGELSTNEFFTLNVDPENLVESNNYKLSFRAKQKVGASFYVHFIGLDGSAPDRNIYMCQRGNGAYWLMSDFEGHDVYNNSGTFHGGLDYSSVDVLSWFDIDFIHFNGTLELWINGTRRVVSHLSNFGNNNYCVNGRKTISEGTITGFAIDADNVGDLVFDSIRITEPKTLNNVYDESYNGGDSIILPLSAVNFYNSNFHVETTFEVMDVAKGDYHPAIKLAGMNNSVKDHNGQEYCVNGQLHVSNNSLRPQLFTQSNNTESPWKGVEGNEITLTISETITYALEFIGDTVTAYLDGTEVYTTSFSELDIIKGVLQYVMITNQNSGLKIKNVKYYGFDDTKGAVIVSDKKSIKTGQSVTFKAYTYGSYTDEYSWFVDDVDQNVSDSTFVYQDISSGEHSIAYKSTETTSNVVTINALDSVITITADKSEMYENESTTFTAELDGDFTGQSFKWYVNDVATDEEGVTFILTGLNVGTYRVAYKSNETSSNVLSLTVLESLITLSSNKGLYDQDEEAVFIATLLGLDSNVELTWTMDGVIIPDEKGSTLSLPLNNINKTKLTVVCSYGTITSNEVTIGIKYDILSKFEQDETFKTFYEMTIEEGGTYGTFTYGSDSEGTYLSAETNGEQYMELSGAMPTKPSYTYSYSLFIPNDISSTYYVYPCLLGGNARFPNNAIEVAFRINESEMDPYLKDQGSNTTYNSDVYGLGGDLSYNGIPHKGGWNDVVIAVDDTCIAVYLNNEMVLFVAMGNLSMPSGLTMNWFPDGGSGLVPFRIKNIVVKGLSDPIPDVTDVSISSSHTSGVVGDTIVITAVVSPWDAVIESFDWYVNGILQSEKGSRLTFNPSEAGNYEIYCVAKGFSSQKINIEIRAAQPEKPTKKGCRGTIISTSIICASFALAGSILLITLKKKKNEK